MEKVSKMKGWISSHAPFLTNLYQNKYIGMAYDQFASLPAQQQQLVIFGTLGAIVSGISIFVGLSYYSLWDVNSQIETLHQVRTELLNFEKYKRDRAGDLALLERNKGIQGPNQLKVFLDSMARNVGISNRFYQITESEKTPSEPAPPIEVNKVQEKGGKGTKPGVKVPAPKRPEIRIKEAIVKMQRLNLQQVLSYLKAVEYGVHNLDIVSLKLLNESGKELRGYMSLEFKVTAILFDTTEG